MHESCFQYPADTWTEVRWTLISGACGQRLCLHDFKRQDASYEPLVIQTKKIQIRWLCFWIISAHVGIPRPHVGEKEHGEHNLCPCTQRSNPHFSSSFDNRRVSASNTTCVRKPKAFSTPTCCLFWLQVQGTTGPWTRPASTNERRRLHRSTPLQIKASSTWKPLEQRKKNTTGRPAPKCSQYILTWSIRLHIKSARIKLR